MSEVTTGGNGDPPDLVEMVEGMTYNVGSAVMALWRGDLRIAAWHVNREMERLRTPETPAQEARNAETPPMQARPGRRARIRIGRWDYEAEISPKGIATYENRVGETVQVDLDHYKVIRYR